jgi:hypothetical protein
VSIWFSLPAVDTGRCGAGPRLFFCLISVGEPGSSDDFKYAELSAPFHLFYKQG